jgi:hypothetical protein
MNFGRYFDIVSEHGLSGGERVRVREHGDHGEEKKRVGRGCSSETAARLDFQGCGASARGAYVSVTVPES